MMPNFIIIVGQFCLVDLKALYGTIHLKKQFIIWGTSISHELTKVITQNDERSDIDCQTEHFSYSHGPVPGSYRQGNHQQFCQNQGSERYGHHVNKVLVKKPQSTVNNDTTWKSVKKCMCNINIVSAICMQFS